MAPDDLISRDPVGLSQRDMLLRLDARLDKFEPRMRALEDASLVAHTERKTLFTVLSSMRIIVLLGAAAGPIIATLIAAAAIAQGSTP